MGDPCDAGRRAYFGGRWSLPCPNEYRHVIGADGGRMIQLCDTHFAEASEAGMIDEPDIGPEEFERRFRPG